VSLSSVFFDVPLAWLPSAMFCTPDRAACTHLIVSAAALVDVTAAESHRHVVNQLRHLKAPQLPVAAVTRNHFLRF
jgi:hypothetical protein